MTERDPFLPDRRVDASEHESSESFAQEKFDRLMQLDHYGVRFVNIDEYRVIFNGTGKIGHDIYWFRDKAEDDNNSFSVGACRFPFSRYIQLGKSNHWEYIIEDQANWSAALEGDLPIYRDYLLRLKEIHRDVMNTERNGPIREKVLRKAYEFLAPIIKGKLQRIAKHRAEIQRDLNWIAQTYGEEISRKVQEESNDALKSKDIKTVGASTIEQRIIKKIGINMIEEDKKQRNTSMIQVPILLRIASHNIWLREIDDEKEKILNDFLENTNYLNENPDNLRRIINILSYLFNTRPGWFGEKDAEHQSYHVGLFIDDSVIREGYGIWGTTDSHFDPQIHILGAISIMPNKELAQEMQSVSAGSHPIFAANGACLYPRQKKSTEPVS